jgi:hypothetical protein
MCVYLIMTNSLVKSNLIASFQASEKIQFIESDSQNGTKSGIHERSICLEVNETESLSECSE